MKYRIISSLDRLIFFSLKEYLVNEKYQINREGWAEKFPNRFIDVDCSSEDISIISLKFNVRIHEISDEIYGKTYSGMWFDELNTRGTPKLDQSVGRGIRQSKTIPTIIDHISKVSS